MLLRFQFNLHRSLRAASDFIVWVLLQLQRDQLLLLGLKMLIWLKVAADSVAKLPGLFCKMKTKKPKP